MGNIITYIKENGSYSFEQKAFNEVDALVFSVLSYLRYDGAVFCIAETNHPISIKEVSHLLQLGGLTCGLAGVNNEALLLAAANSKRYGKIKLDFYESIIDVERELQFSAITFLLKDKSAFIAFRGTDETIIGWKEDFNMGFLCPIPAQEEGLAYLERVSKRVSGSIRIGGHSKGGNIAVYAAAYSNKQIQERILAVYSHDGPGFKDSIFETKEYQRIKDRIHKIIPRSSIVGLLLQQQENHMIVDSSQSGILQHDPFSWKVQGEDFVYFPEVDQKALLMNHTLNGWLSNLADEKRKIIINSIFDVIHTAEQETVVELKAEWRKAIPAMINAGQEMDIETKKFLKQMFRELLKQIVSK